MDQYGNLVFSVCLKLTGDYFLSEDITQETFIAAYRHYGEFDGQNEKAWIARIAANRSIDALRKAENRNIPTAEEEFPEPASEGTDPQREVQTKEIIREVRKACEGLPEPYIEPSILYFIEGMTAAQIAEKNGQNLSTVQTRIRRAREMLRKTIRKEDLLP